MGQETISRWGGRIKELAGSVLGDEKLQTQGRLEREEAEVRRRARLAEGGAAASHRRADVRGRQAQLAAERVALEAEEQSVLDRKRIEVQTAMGTERVDQAAELAEAQVEGRRETLDDASRRAELQARIEHAREEQRAEQAEAAAEDLRRRAEHMDKG